MSNVAGIRAGRAFVELSADDSKLQAGLRSAQARLKAFGDGVGAIGMSMVKAVAPLAGAMAASTKIFAGTGDKLDKMAGRTGISVEALSELSYATNQSGTSLDTLETSVKKMQRTITEAGQGTAAAGDALAGLGLSFAMIENLSPEQQFKVIADRLSRIDDPTRRAAAALEVFGRSGTEMLPLLQNGARGIEDLQRKARELGLTMSATTAKDAAVLNDALGTLWVVGKNAAVAVGAALAPAVTELVGRATKVVQQITTWIRENNALIVRVAKVTVGVLALGTALLVIGKTIGIVAAGIKLATTAITVYKTALTAATVATKTLWAVMAANPLGLALAAVAAIGAAVYVLTRRTYELSNAMQKQRAAGDELRAADLDKLRRLAELSRKQQLNAAEMTEAQQLSRELGGRYGELGVAIDTVANRVELSADAFDRLAESMRATLEVQLAKEFDEEINNLQAINQQIQGLAGAWAQLKHAYLQAFVVGGEGPGAALGRLEAQRGDVQQRIAALQSRRAALRGGDLSALTGGVTGQDASGWQSVGSAAAAPAVDEWERKVHQLRLQQIADAQARELALLNERYDYEVQKAREAGQETKNIELARDLEIDALNRKFAEDRAAADRRGTHEIEMLRIEALENVRERELRAIMERYRYEIEEARQAGDSRRVALLEAQRAAEIDLSAAREELRVREANLTRRQSIAELELRTKYKGFDLEMKLLALEKERALEAAKRAGENIELVEREFELREQIARLANQGGNVGGYAVAGTFSGARLEGLGVRRSEELTELRRANSHLRNIDNKLSPGAYQP